MKQAIELLYGLGIILTFIGLATIFAAWMFGKSQ